MADRIDNLTERVQVVEGKVDHLTERVQVVEEKVDRLSTTMVAGFVEQREYTEFSHARLEAKMDGLEATFDARFSRVDRKLDQLIDARRPGRTSKRRDK